MELTTLSESERRWRKITAPRLRRPQPEGPCSNLDCSRFRAPPEHILAAELTEGYMQQWRDLDARRIQPDRSQASGRPRALRIHHKIDYLSEEPPVSTDDDPDQVLCLDDPEKRLSYRSELSKLFRQIQPLSPVTNDQLPLTLAADTSSRLRRSDRHELPPPLSNNSTPIPTLLLECWTRNLRRGCTKDQHRIVLEFRGTQTLEDLHQTLVELRDDTLWKSKTSKGLFFLEGVLYGDKTYGQPVEVWLRQLLRQKPALTKRLYGVDGSVRTRSMKGVVLGDLPLRLGVRYWHVCHGDVDTSIFLTDRGLVAAQACPYPIIHDIGTSGVPPECEGCRHRPGAFVTPTDCEATDGHRVLCQACCCALNLQKLVTPYKAWKNESELSMSATDDTVF